MGCMVCEAEIDYDQSIEAANIGGCAYRVVLVDELPGPLELEERKREARAFFRAYLWLCLFSAAWFVFNWFILLPINEPHWANLQAWLDGVEQQEAVSE